MLRTTNVGPPHLKLDPLAIFSQGRNIDGTCRIMNKWSAYEASRLIGHDSFWMKSPRMAHGTHVETILFVTFDMFPIDDGYIGVSNVRPRAQFYRKRKKKCDGTWRAIIKTGWIERRGTIRLTIAHGKLNLPCRICASNLHPAHVTRDRV